MGDQLKERFQIDRYSPLPSFLHQTLQVTYSLVLALSPAEAEIGYGEVRIVDFFEYAMHTHAHNPIHYYRYP